jgi:hypothetical protein
VQRETLIDLSIATTTDSDSGEGREESNSCVSRSVRARGQWNLKDPPVELLHPKSEGHSMLPRDIEILHDLRHESEHIEANAGNEEVGRAVDEAEGHLEIRIQANGHLETAKSGLDQGDPIEESLFEVRAAVAEEEASITRRYF